jgi:phosphoribosylaminoimidazolecarboxamide formyltransferase/IMP cyclohydrolase
MPVTVKRALISVSDKTGVVDFAKALAARGVEIISTGGTARMLAENGVAVVRIADYTGFPEILDGRVKTLHPKVHGGILARRDLAEHMATLEEHGIGPIDMVVVNLYPFEATISKPNVNFADAIEQIDIGGPSMVRSAAKNHTDVAVVTSCQFYVEVLEALEASDGRLPDALLRKLGLEAFRLTAHYDRAIADYLADQADEDLPEVIGVEMTKKSILRYGENPHQKAALYVSGKRGGELGLAHARVLGGKELSYNNYVDLEAALETARDFAEPTAVVIKHTNPCGCASAETLADALTEAWLGDPMSAYGSVIGLNRKMDVETARQLGSSKYLREVIEPRYAAETGLKDVTILAAFVEAVVAPGYEPEALEILKRRKNLRILEVSDWEPRTRGLAIRPIPGGYLVQEPDIVSVPPSEYRVVTKVKPTGDQLASLAFADRVAKHVHSNAIVLVKGAALVGCGAGQMSRFDSSHLAARKAGDRAKGAVLASDAMFPARDGLDAAAATGAAAVIQPGGSVRDDEVIAAADEHGIAMVLTGMRHFLH